MNAPRRPPRRRIDGVLLLDKPPGMSSNAALQAARRLFNAAKAGHTGTLDPMATGLLPLCFGESTKFAGELLDADKEYEATLQLGVTTDTGDAEGRILARAPVAVTAEALAQALGRLSGPILQVPPMHSALKRDGKPLYEYARAGVELERQPRPVTIHALELRAFGGDSLSLRVACSKGTYIRVLAEDLGRLLGCGAHLTALRRTRLGRLVLSDAVSLADLEASDEAGRMSRLAPVDFLLGGLDAFILDDAAALAFGHGRSVPCDRCLGTRLRVFAGMRFLGLGEADGAGLLLPRRLVAGAEA